MVEKTTEKKTGFVQRFVEGLVGQAKKAKGSLESRAGLQPILSLESRLNPEKLKKLLDLMGDRFVPSALPNLKDQTVAEIGESPLRFTKLVAEKRPKFFCGVVIDGTGTHQISDGSSSLILKGSFKSIPFEGNFFDCVIARLTTPNQGDVVSAFKEIGRILTPQGTGLLLDFHPFGLYAKTGIERLRGVMATIRGLEDYYKMCRVSGLSIVNVQEGFMDDTLRNQLITPAEMDAFREIKGTPLVLFLQVTKK